MEDRRIRLIERLCRLPEAQLARIETFLDCLGTPSPSQPPSQIPAIADLPPPSKKDWPHAPIHRLSEGGTFIVTASTLDKQHFFRGAEMLTMLEGKLLGLAKSLGIALEAWAVFSNHYHFVAHASGDGNRIPELIASLHSESALALNRRDNAMGRQVWFNYWETRLSFEKSYLARLNYVHQNAVKHGLVGRANHYPWCSAAWFERTATRAQVGTIYGFKTDRIRIEDAYEPVVE